MSAFEISTQRLALAEEFGKNPFTLEEGNRAAAITGALERRSLLVMDFEGLDSFGIDFITPALAGLGGVISRMREASPMIVAAHTTDDLDYVFDVYLSHLPTPGITVENNGRLNLLTRNKTASGTFLAAKDLTLELGSFTPNQLANSLGLKIPNTNQRLRVMREAGAVTRLLDTTAEHGERFLYRTILNSDLSQDPSNFGA